uniref:3-hydroxyacyl-CoA dehydrogenase NAD binding domain-containing protein n=1 Tax=uncultured archaeon MedDCM-OCT-S05-C205 TaxID=743089 RepID=D6PBH4_9ARCH|nr:hypothetical protein [uncultured archaeon MedDCM-OCT-S05-C205]
MEIRCVAVIGAGTMGAGIAQVCAQSGWKTNLFDAFPEGLERGMQRIDAFWDKGIARGKTTAQQKELWQANLNTFSDMAEAVAGADLIIEAVPEIPDLKHSIFLNWTDSLQNMQYSGPIHLHFLSPILLLQRLVPKESLVCIF